jgi:hypothetical protein
MENNDLITNPAEPHEAPKKNKKGRGISPARQTLYRVTVRNQLRSISIADQKANILIGINTVLISIIIAILGAESIMPGLSFIAEFDLNIPLVIFLLACFGSGIIAVLAVRPTLKPWKNKAKGKIFFMNYRDINLDHFQEYIGDIMESGTKIYSSLNTDMYLLGQAIFRKFYLLRLAYTIYMIGLSGLVISFLLIRVIF